MPRQHLLIVDSDLRTRRVLEVSLRKAGFNIATAQTAAAALEHLAHAEPDLIISEVALPDTDGFTFRQVLQADDRLRLVPFLFLTDDGSLEHKIRGLELGVDDYLTKPIYIKEFITRINILLQRKRHDRLAGTDSRTKFMGRLADLAMVDLLQTIDASRKSGTIHLRCHDGPATLWFRQGAIIDAVMGPLRGATVVYRLLTFGDGDFEVDFTDVDRPASITDSNQVLLLEGMRRLDEWGRLLEQLPPLDSVMIANRTLLQDRQSDLSPEALALIRAFDGRRSTLDIIDASGLDDLQALHLASVAYFEGLLVPATRATQSLVAKLGSHETLESWSHPGLPAVAEMRPIGASEPDSSAIPIILDGIDFPHAQASNDLAHLDREALPDPPAYPLPFPSLSTTPEGDDEVVGSPALEAIPLPRFPVIQLRARGSAAGVSSTVLQALAGQLALIETGELNVFAEEGVPPGLPDAATQHALATPLPIVQPSRRQRELIPPQPGTRSPEPGSDRAAFHGVFDYPDEPDPEPQRLPRYIGDADIGLERRINAELGIENPSHEEFPTLELATQYEAPSRGDVDPVAGPAQPPIAGSLGDESVPVRTELPAEEALAAGDARPTSGEPTPASPRQWSFPFGLAAALILGLATAAVALGRSEQVAAISRQAAPQVRPSPAVATASLSAPSVEQAEQLYRSGDLAKAKRMLDDVAAATSPSARALVLQANILIEEHNYDGARASALAATQRDPAYPDAHLALGVIAQEQGTTAEAIRAYEKYLELAPSGLYAQSVRRQLRYLARLVPAIPGPVPAKD